MENIEDGEYPFLAVTLGICEVCYVTFYFPEREKHQFTTQLSHILVDRHI